MAQNKSLAVSVYIYVPKIDVNIETAVAGEIHDPEEIQA